MLYSNAVQRKPVTEPELILKMKLFYDEEQSTPSVGWPQNFKETSAEGDI